MATNKREIARRIAICYVILGSTYFLLWYFVISPSGNIDPILIALFYISLPAILVAPYVVFEIGAQIISARMKRIESPEETDY
ncbi:MAG: hypothetical protein AM326_08105 [Candidatus Thorarchaeota archaeon SMTZ-45]|nr:MAG: hypothetical protein AM325_08495 [Candidatus Thorarchaeota archaeon SMTZ1-45]KXH75988.1 MAG: hypothetical protein AM326_08105 [Candidatus Thorarchaeota archaeon SMTZ-45]